MRLLRDHTRLAGVLAAIVALLIGGIFASTLLSKKEKSMDNEYYPTGYREKAELMLEKEVITYDPQKRKLRYHPEKAKTEGFSQFYASSRRLRRDISEFNYSEEKQAFFRLRRNGTIDTDRAYHRIRLPYPPVSGWDGRMSFYQGSSVGTLVNPNVIIRLQKKPAQGEARHFTLDEPAWRDGKGESNRYVASSFDLRSGKTPLISLVAERNKVILTLKGEQKPVFLNGIRINQNPELEEIRRLTSRHLDERLAGEYILKQDDRLRLGTTDLVMSNLIKGLPGEDYSADMPLAEGLIHGLHLMATSKDVGEAVRDFDLIFTLDQPLHLHVQKQLESFLAGMDKGRYDRKTAPACVTMLDAENGHVLSLATYPTREDVDWLEKNRGQGRARLSEGKLRRLRQNQNLIPIPIGSTTKPLLAACVWEKYPRFRRMRISHGGGQMFSVMGVTIKPPVDGGGAGDFDPQSFLYRSSNSYMLNLYTRSLMEKNWSHYYRKARVYNLVDHDVNQLLKETFDIEISKHAYEGSRPARYEGTIYEPLLKKLGKTDPTELPMALWDVCPERVNLRFDRMEMFRDLIAACVGGGDNWWPNLKRAEAFARLGTARKVRAKVIADAYFEGDTMVLKPAVPFPVLPISAPVMEQVQGGMSRAVTEGTARRLNPAYQKLNKDYAPRGVQFRILSKTGTVQRVVGGPDCSNFAFFLAMGDTNTGEYLGGLSCSVYLENRGKSSNAVQYSISVIDQAANYLFQKYGPH